LATVIIFTVGLPFLFALTGTINNLRHKNDSATTENKIAPTIPSFSIDYEATSSATIKIHGIADPKISVEIFRNNRPLETVISADDGVFKLEADLEKGINTFTAMAISESGQKSATSDTYQVTFLSGKPKLEITTPKDKETVNGSLTTVTGQTDPGNAITVNDRLTIVDKDGKFSYSLNLNSGENKITITATDLAKNETKKELLVTSR